MKNAYETNDKEWCNISFHVVKVHCSIFNPKRITKGENKIELEEAFTANNKEEQE